MAVTGQTYSRKIDAQILAAISGVAQSAAKFATDLRLLAHEQELDEPFETEQVGSSAMAYKRNPMRSERICSLSRFVMGLVPMAEQTAANQWLERTLDDSAARRLYIPQAFLGVDAILRLVLNVVSGMKPNPTIIAKHVKEALPYMATETILMAAVAKGGDRQKLHERIRLSSHEVTSKLKSGLPTIGLVELLQADAGFAGIDWPTILDPRQYVGRAPEQTIEFVEGVVDPIRRLYPSLLDQSADVHV
jgi:adenylosuccinate lyase